MQVREGRLGVELFDDRFIQDPYPLYARMLADGPVHRVGDSEFHAVCTWDAVNEAIARPEDFSSNLTATMTFADGVVGRFDMDAVGGPTQALATADDPAHAAHRKLLVPQLAAKRINELELFVGETADRLWNEGVHDGTIEWMSAMANRLPMMVVTRLIGVPDVDIEQLMRWSYSSTKVVEGLVDEDQLAAAGVATLELASYIVEHFDRAAAEPRDDLLSAVATARASGQLAELTALSMIITLFSAGGESTASLIGTAANILASRPEIQHQVRENPELLNAFLEEVLRYEPPFRGHYRHVLNDTMLAWYQPHRGFATSAVVGCGQSRSLTLGGCQRVSPGSRWRQESYQLRQGRTLLCRRRARAPGSQDRDRRTAQPDNAYRGGGHRSMAAEPAGAAARELGTQGLVTRPTA